MCAAPSRAPATRRFPADRSGARRLTAAGGADESIFHLRGNAAHKLARRNAGAGSKATAQGSADDPGIRHVREPDRRAAAIPRLLRLGGGAALAADGGLHPRACSALAAFALARLASTRPATRRWSRRSSRTAALAARRGAGADRGELRRAHALRSQRLRRDRPAAALAADRPGARSPPMRWRRPTGFGPLSGGAIRLRYYTPLGLSPGDIARVVAFVTVAFGAGLAVTAAVGALWEARTVAGRHPAAARAGSSPRRSLTLAAFGGLLLAARPAGRRCPGSGGRGARPARRAGMMLRQFAVTALDTVAAAGRRSGCCCRPGAIGYRRLPAALRGGAGARHPQPRAGRARRLRGGAAGGARRQPRRRPELLAAFALYRLIYQVLPLGARRGRPRPRRGPPARRSAGRRRRRSAPWPGWRRRRWRRWRWSSARCWSSPASRRRAASTSSG